MMTKQERDYVAYLEMRDRALTDLLFALRDWPELPPPRLLNLLSHAAKYPEDWNAGKRLQREKGLTAIPPKTECELGAGAWTRMRNAIMFHKEHRCP